MMMMMTLILTQMMGNRRDRLPQPTTTTFMFDLSLANLLLSMKKYPPNISSHPIHVKLKAEAEMKVTTISKREMKA